jgi:AmpD protein
MAALRQITEGLAARWWPSPHFTPGRNAPVDLLVIHYISLPPGEFGSGHVIDFFMGRLDPDLHPYYRTLRNQRVSSHFFLERTGQVHQFVDTGDTAWHAGESRFEQRSSCNDFSIGIELEGDEHRLFTDEQYVALIGLCRAMIAQYPLLTPARIVGHCEIAPGRKIDPGPHFDWQRLRSGLALGDVQ